MARWICQSQFLIKLKIWHTNYKSFGWSIILFQVCQWLKCSEVQKFYYCKINQQITEAAINDDDLLYCVTQSIPLSVHLLNLSVLFNDALKIKKTECIKITLNEKGCEILKSGDCSTHSVKKVSVCVEIVISINLFFLQVCLPKTHLKHNKLS